jgi:glycerol uptake facilitator-like aquaporin
LKWPKPKKSGDLCPALGAKLRSVGQVDGVNGHCIESRLMSPDLSRRLVAEALGTALLVAAVVGSVVMAETLTSNVALLLMANAIASGAILVVLIAIFGPISGAHFNPAVSLVFALQGFLPAREAAYYSTAQIAGGVAGTITVHMMFALPLFELSLKARTGGGQWFAEAVAAFGLLITILAGVRFDKKALPWLVGLYITAACWFTASMAFANPAVAIARALTNSAAGIRPVDLPGFIIAELVGAVCAMMLMAWLLRYPNTDNV